ncbi:TPA: hypothetical protein J1X93_004547 [Escherichia coli]|nr:hypothetical protein [Escherichia coli]HBA7348564.1 hypothetical protein [Escherichia coli]HBA7362926.1 hypothetical protein [Escherichia coli]HBA8266243.1 hypothetical protein [Escherichia coli]
MYQPQNFLPQASKTFASAPGQLPRDVVSVPVGKVHCGEIPEDPLPSYITGADNFG